MYAASNEVEATLLASVSDEATLDVYADWLEERGDLDRAELLRLHKALRRDPLNHWNADRFAILSRNVDAAWRDRVLQVPQLVEEEIETPPLPPPPPAVVQLERGWGRTFYIDTAAMPRKIPRWIRLGSPSAACVLVVSILMYWLLH